MGLLWQYSTQKAVWIDKDETLQPTPKVVLHGRKIMLYVLWGLRGIIHFVFLNCSQKLNAELYSQQLQRMHENLWKRIYLLIGEI